MKVLVGHCKSSHYLTKGGQRQSLCSGRREGRRAGIQAKGGEPCCKALGSSQFPTERDRDRNTTRKGGKKKEEMEGQTFFEVRSQLRLQNKRSHNDRLADSCSVYIRERVELSRNSSLYTNWGCVLLANRLIQCPLKHVALWGGQKGME